jgi:hypothetical protein
MKSVLTAVLAASFLLSANVFAQAKNFEGFTAELSTGSQKTSLSNGDLFSRANAPLGAAILSGSKHTNPAIIGLSYGFKLTDQFVVGLGLDYNLTTSSIVSQCRGCLPPAAVTQKVSNRYSLYVAPGFSLSSTSLVYVKFGYTQASMSHSASDGTVLTGGPSKGGWLTGLGYKRFITDSVYGFAEYSSAQNSAGKYTSTADGNNWDSGKLKTESFLVGAGYKF